MIFLLILFSCIWGIIISQEVSPLNLIKNYLGLGTERRIFSEIPIIDYILYCIWRLINCPRCLSYWIFSISYLIMYSSGIGFIIGGIVYFLTGMLQKVI